jgi:sulfide:quinone oxidoreductase
MTQDRTIHDNPNPNSLRASFYVLPKGLSEYGIDMSNLAHMKSLKRKLQEITEGTILVSICDVPYKCPPSPFEISFLIHELLSQRGIRDKVRIVVIYL